MEQQPVEEALQKRILDLANESSDPDVLLKAATILKYGVESSKQRAETINLDRGRRTEGIRFFVPIIAPLVMKANSRFRATNYYAGGAATQKEYDSEIARLSAETGIASGPKL